jgi:RNase adapter protein RapZ
VVVVTGLSGAGKSTALHALEDLGYFCVDNLPPPILQPAIEACEAAGMRRIAFGIDARVGFFLEGANDAISRIDARRDVVILFLDASDEALLRRFNETRRPHPMSSGRRPSEMPPPPAAPATRRGAGAIAVLDSIQLERERLAPLRASADLDLDTTRLSRHELRQQVLAFLGPGRAEQPRMATRVVSFGFKFGIPVDADLMFDVRFLDNPHFVPELRPLTGLDAPVTDYIFKNPETHELLRRTEDLLEYCLPRYEREGKSYLTIAVGCTGGRHRSVALAERLGASMVKKTGLPITVVHRDVSRKDKLGSDGQPGGSA